LEVGARYFVILNLIQDLENAASRSKS
jgi:hypothetical protein